MQKAKQPLVQNLFNLLSEHILETFRLQIHCTNQNTMCNLDHYVRRVYKQQTYVFHVHERFGHVFEHHFYFPQQFCLLSVLPISNVANQGT